LGARLAGEKENTKYKMKVNFFEEFPNEENLMKAKFINFNSTIYLAAKSLKEFREIKIRLNKINKKIEAAYWPILEKSYWISPFSYTSELNKLFKELSENKDKKLKVLIDLELPFLDSRLFFKNLFCFSKNKKIIKSFFENLDDNIEIMTAEYPMINNFFRRVIELLGVSYSLDRFSHKKCVMFYSSLIKSKFIKRKMTKLIFEEHKKYDKICVGLGTIAKGIVGNEPILSTEDLKKDLDFLNRMGIEETIIFRLGGLNEKYIKILNNYKNSTMLKNI
jgi:hypothetical protein